MDMNIQYVAPAGKIIVKTDTKRVTDGLNMDYGTIRTGVIVDASSTTTLREDQRVYFRQTFAECPFDLDERIVVSMDESNVIVAWDEIEG